MVAVVAGCRNRLVGTRWANFCLCCTKQCNMHVMAAIASCRNCLVGTGWAKSCLGCTNMVRNSCSYLVGASFLAVKAVWAQNKCSLAENADYCKLIDEKGW